jgi:hypothetical protein
MLPDIPQARRSEERIDDGVADHIGIAVPLQAPLPLELDTGQYQPPALREGVYVEAYSDPHPGPPHPERSPGP